MPLQLFELKKYRCGTPPVSKMSDNEHATAPLRNSEPLSVQHGIGDAEVVRAGLFDDAMVPPSSLGNLNRASCKRREDRREVATVGAGEDARHVLPYQPADSESESKQSKFEREFTARVVQSSALTGNAVRLAWSSSDEKIDICMAQHPPDVARAQGSEIPPQNRPVPVSAETKVMPLIYSIVPLPKDMTRHRRNLRKQKRLPSQAMPCDGRCSDSCRYFDVHHAVAPKLIAAILAGT